MTEEKQLMDFPSNSRLVHEPKPTPEKEGPKKLERVTTGKVVTKKKTIGQRFMETFVKDDIENVTSYIVQDILIAAAKGVISDVVQAATDVLRDGIDTILWGERRPGRSSNRRESGRPYVSYEKQYDSRRSERERDRREFTMRDRARHNFDNIVIRSQAEANDVIDRLVDQIDRFGQATVADLYDLVGITEEHTDRNYGWTNLRTADTRRVREGWQLILPRPTLLD